jgi:predicted amidohydrolase
MMRQNLTCTLDNTLTASSCRIWEDEGMKLAMAQMKNEGSMEQNLARSIHAIHEAAEQGVDLILFPEVHLTEFFPQYPGQDVASYGIEIDSEIVAAFQDACAQNNIAAVPNIYLKENGKFFDASIFIDKAGEMIGVQKMVHVAQAEKFYEQDYYAPSDTGFQAFDTELGKIGIVVCFDRHYSVAIAMCNRVGTEGSMVFAGESLVADANGNVIVKADDAEELIFAEIDLPAVGKVRSGKPYTTLRRKEWYR